MTSWNDVVWQNIYTTLCNFAFIIEEIVEVFVKNNCRTTMISQMHSKKIHFYEKRRKLCKFLYYNDKANLFQ